jgi:hypothetical protein
MTFVSGLSSSAVTAVRTSLTNLLGNKQEELRIQRYSTSYALAYGFARSSVEPIHDEPPQDDETGRRKDPVLHLHTAGTIGASSCLHRTLAKIREGNHSTEVVRTEFEEGRARDLMTVSKKPGGDLKYFGFTTPY